MWSPFAQTFDIFAHRVEELDTGTSNVPSHDAWKIDLPGGGFIERPGSEPQSPPNYSVSSEISRDEFSTPEERQSLLDELDNLSNEKASRERTVQDLVIREDSLTHSLNEALVALEIQDKSLSHFRDTLRAQREEMQIRFNSNKAAVQTLQDDLAKLTSDDAIAAGDLELAAESGALRRQIAHDCKERRDLQDKVDKLDELADVMEIKCQTVRREEKTLAKAISAHVLKLAEDGGLGREVNVDSKIVVQAEIHPPPCKPAHSLQSGAGMLNPQRLTVVSLANNRTFQQLAERIEVLDDQGALRREVNRGGFASALKRFFVRRLKSPGHAESTTHKSTHGRKIPGKTERPGKERPSQGKQTKKNARMDRRKDKRIVLL